MRIAVFADIHANLEAFTSFLAHSRGQRVGAFFFLGDIIGYGPNPNECLDLLRRMDRLTAVLGNHDAAAIWKTSPYQMGSQAREALFWTMDQLSGENTDYLNNLKYIHVHRQVCFCHAMPSNPSSWSYLIHRHRAYQAFAGSSYWLSFVSHTHSPQIVSLGKYWRVRTQKTVPGQLVELSSDHRWIVNCGSIGQPRDGIVDGAYCIYDDVRQTVVFQRFSYDVQATSAKILAAGLPSSLAMRLQSGS